MRIELVGQVTSMERKERFPTDSHGVTNYRAKQVPYNVATIKLLDNLHNIEGTCQVETNELKYLQYVGIIIDSDSRLQLPESKDDIVLVDKPKVQKTFP